jgi:hypothetical protein
MNDIQTPSFFSLGLTHGKLSHDYQPVGFPAPSGLMKASVQDQQDFWKGFHQGWDEQEASTVFFHKVEA